MDSNEPILIDTEEKLLEYFGNPVESYSEKYPEILREFFEERTPPLWYIRLKDENHI